MIRFLNNKAKNNRKIDVEKVIAFEYSVDFMESQPNLEIIFINEINIIISSMKEIYYIDICIQY